MESRRTFSPQQTTKQVQTSKIRSHGIAYALADGGGRKRGRLKSILATASLGILVSGGSPMAQSALVKNIVLVRCVRSGCEPDHGKQ